MRMHRKGVGIKQVESTIASNTKIQSKSISETKQNPFNDEEDQIDNMLSSKIMGGSKINQKKQTQFQQGFEPEENSFTQGVSVIVKKNPNEIKNQVKSVERPQFNKQETKYIQQPVNQMTEIQILNSKDKKQINQNQPEQKQELIQQKPQQQAQQILNQGKDSSTKPQQTQITKPIIEQPQVVQAKPQPQAPQVIIQKTQQQPQQIINQGREVSPPKPQKMQTGQQPQQILSQQAPKQENTQVSSSKIEQSKQQIMSQARDVSPPKPQKNQIISQKPQEQNQQIITQQPQKIIDKTQTVPNKPEQQKQQVLSQPRDVSPPKPQKNQSVQFNIQPESSFQQPKIENTQPVINKTDKSQQPTNKQEQQVIKQQPQTVNQGRDFSPPKVQKATSKSQQDTPQIISQQPQQNQQILNSGNSNSPPKNQKIVQSQPIKSQQDSPPKNQKSGKVEFQLQEESQEFVREQTIRQDLRQQDVFMSSGPDIEEEDELQQEFEPDVVERVYSKPQLVRKPNQLLQLESLNLDDIDTRCRAISPVNPQECDRANLKSILDENKKTKHQYKDVIFPPNLSAIFIRSLETKSLPQCKLFKNWQPIKQQFSINSLSLSKFIDPNDIQEGKQVAFNQNVLSALSCLAEYPETIQYILENQTINENGIYYVKINKQGVWRFIVVDDYFPFFDDKLLVSGPRIDDRNSVQDFEIWSSIVEKALIKTYGSYENLEYAQTTINEILRDLTGGPVLTYDINDENLESLIKSNLSKGCIVIAKQREGTSDNFRKNFKFCVLSSTNGKIEIRNPWGFESEKQDFTVKDKGICILKLDVFQQLFEQILIVYPMTKNTQYVSRSINKKHKSYNIQKIVFKEAQEQCFFEFTQVDKRMLKKNYQNYQYCQVRIILFSIEDGYIDGILTEQQRTTTLVCSNLKQGEYYLITYANFQFGLIQHGTISYQGTEAINFERIHFKNNPEFLNDLYSNHIQNKLGKKIVNDQAILQPNEGIVIVPFVSKSTKPETIVKDFSNIKNANMIRKGNDQSSQKVTIELQPNQVKTILFSIDQGITIGVKTLKECQFK